MMRLIAQNHFFIASKNTNSVFSANDEVARPRMLKNFLLSEKKLLNAILGVKAQKHEKCFFLMKWNAFCNVEDRFSWVWAFCRKSFQSLIAQNPFFIASKNTNSVFSANDEVARPRMLKNFSLSEKMLLNAILGVKAQKHEKCFFLIKWTVFCNAEDRFSWVWGFLAEKVILELNCTKSLLYSF